MALTMSEQPRKQRKARYAAPLHLRQRLVHAHLSKEAKERLKTKRRAVAVRAGDKVKIMRGKFRGHSGKVSEVDLRSLKIYVEGAVARKAKGAEVLVAIEPSNVMIMELDMSDKKRKEKFGEKAGGSGTADVAEREARQQTVADRRPDVRGSKQGERPSNQGSEKTE